MESLIITAILFGVTVKTLNKKPVAAGGGGGATGIRETQEERRKERKGKKSSSKRHIQGHVQVQQVRSLEKPLCPGGGGGIRNSALGESE